MIISYNWTKKTTITEKFEKGLKKYVINFKTKGYKLTNWFGNVNNSILNFKFKRLVSNLKLPKEQKQQFQEKNWVRKVSKALKNELFTRNFPMFN